MRKQQDNNFKIKLFTDTDVLVNNYKIIIDIIIYLCYNIFEVVLLSYLICDAVKGNDKKFNNKMRK